MAAGIGLLASTSGAFAPLWVPVVLVQYPRGELTRGTVGFSVGLAAIFAVFGFMIPDAAAAILGCVLVAFSLPGGFVNETAAAEPDLPSVESPNPSAEPAAWPPERQTNVPIFVQY